MNAKKIVLAIIPLVMLLGTARAANEVVSYCPSDADNKSIYTFKRANLLPDGWTPSAAWNLSGTNRVSGKDPADIQNNLTEGQYKFTHASYYKGQVLCTYMLPGKSEYEASAILQLLKSGVSIPSSDISPVPIIGGDKHWVNYNALVFDEHERTLLCGENTFGKVTYCPFKQ